MKGHNAADAILDVEVIADGPDLIPAYQSDMAAGLDLRCNVAGGVVIQSGQVLTISTGIRVHPLRRRDVVGIVVPRSSVGVKRGLMLANTVGVIDADYQGEIILNMRNMSAKSALVEQGERLAQLVFLPILVANLIPCASFSAETRRGENGFGSTGRDVPLNVANLASQIHQEETERGQLLTAVAALES